MAKLIFETKSHPVGPRETFGKVLVMGAGPAAMVVSTLLETNLCSELWMYTVDIPGERPVYDELEANGGEIVGQGKIARRVGLNGFFLGENELSTLKAPDTIFLCVQNQYYPDCVSTLGRCGLLRPGQTISTLSSRLGSGAEIGLAIKDSGLNPRDFGIVSFCIYFGATKAVGTSRTVVSTRATKAQVWAGIEGHTRSDLKELLIEFLGQVGTRIRFLDNTLESEIHSINVFCHAQLTMIPQVLDEMFGLKSAREYLYRPEPEGFLTMEGGDQMAKAELDINRVLESLGLSRVNMLELLLKEIYPVPSMATDEEIETFHDWDETRRAQACYDWFYGRQNDPFTGEPHLNAVKLPRAVEVDGKFVVPRVPGEDYVGIALLIRIAKLTNVDVRTLEQMKLVFDEFVAGLPAPISLDLNRIDVHTRLIAEDVVEKCRRR